MNGENLEDYYRQQQYELQRAGNCFHSFVLSVESVECEWGTTPDDNKYPPCADCWQDCPLSKGVDE